ncbi:MAG: glycosyl hydrolase [Flavobacterium sp.]|uniref:glycoside hydrolase family 26 protein n=1 Tax=Flavobacterium sp. TaxID=239 RepID=UPI0022C94B0B|nr:glycosyl hydrolase [Flavobacterium sp.]MCZ8196918.1 glycosyl hydrolase [Flavobacterium sp.]
MKEMISFLIVVTTILISCSKENDVVPTPSPPVVTIPDPVTPQNVRTFMIDPYATDETVALFYNLRKLSQSKFAIGQQDAFNAFYGVSGNSDIRKTTGNDPALLGSDFMFITDKSNNGLSNNWFYQQEIIITDDVKEAYSKGMINVFCWHLREPNNEDSFYASDMTPEQKNTAFRSILPGGSKHDWYKLKLDKVASVISNLKDNNNKLIPVIFRPFHEFDGNWFWWGANYCSPQEYKTVFQFTVDYLKNTKNVHNILYSFSPDNTYTTTSAYLSRYPGDGYVDVLGMDNYGDFNNQGVNGSNTANSKLKYLSDLAIEKKKIAALTETGYHVTSTTPAIPNWFSTYLYDAMTKNNVQLAFVMFWNNGNGGYYVPTPTASNASDFNSFASKPKSVLQNTLPNMYVLPN